jgi:lipoprotein-releasing system permease protein
LSYETFIAQKILSGKSGKKRLTNPVVKIAIAGITLGVAVMIIAVTVVTGFRNEITSKVIGFGAHIKISHFDSNSSYEEVPLLSDRKLIAELAANPNIKHVQEYANKAGIIKTNEELQGIVLKGVSGNYDKSFFVDKMIDGRFVAPTDSNNKEVVISNKIAKRLQLKTGDDMVVYFIEDPPRIRKLKITGIYETGLDEFDNLYAFCDIGMVRKLNNWNENQSGGIEILVKDLSQLNQLTDYVYHTAGYQYYTQNIIEQYPQIFSWLDLQNINVVIIITLILLVAGISMISTLLIIILENSTLIGILKSLGASDISIRKIFIYIALPVIGTGIVFGNVAGLGLCLLQQQFGIITLPQESYYVSQVPVNFSIPNLLLLNLGTIVACFLMLIGPSMVISRISPTKVIRFD